MSQLGSFFVIISKMQGSSAKSWMVFGRRLPLGSPLQLSTWNTLQNDKTSLCSFQQEKLLKGSYHSHGWPHECLWTAN